MKYKRPHFTPPPPPFMEIVMDFTYHGEIEIFDPSDIIEGEEAIAADDERLRLLRCEEEKQNAASATESDLSSAGS